MSETSVHDTKAFLAGAVKRTITPTVRGRRVFMAGYDDGRLATDIHDELWVRAVAVRQGDTTLILIALDLLGLFRGDFESIRDQVIQEGAPGEGLIITCTHNHAGPDTLGLWGQGPFGSGLNLRYMNFLRSEVARVALLAIDGMEPAQATLARTEVADLPGQGQSGELAVLQLKTRAGKPLAILVNYPLVPQVLARDNTVISADFPNWLYRELERSRDEVVLYVCAEAGQDAPSAVQERPWDEAERIGRQLAAAVRSVLAGLSPTPIDRLLVHRMPFSIPDDDLLAKWLRSARSLRQRALDSEMGLVQFGPARMAVLPGLVAPELGLEIRKMLDAPYRFLLCMSNDHLGPILSQALTSPPPSAQPVDHSAPDASQVGTILCDQIDELMRQIRAG